MTTFRNRLRGAGPSKRVGRKDEVKGYSRAQIVLHWSIAALVVVQVIAHEAMERVYAARQRGEAVPDLPLADAHVACGILVFVLAVARVYIRLVRGAPPPPESEHPVLKVAAVVTHMLLYAIILAMPITGALAWFWNAPSAAMVHSAAMPLVAFLILIHTVAALYHHFVLRTDVLRRMLRAERSRRPDGRSAR